MRRSVADYCAAAYSPVVVMDEGHKATSDLAFRTLYGFNPCFVLELRSCPVAWC